MYKTGSWHGRGCLCKRWVWGMRGKAATQPRQQQRQSSGAVVWLGIAAVASVALVTLCYSLLAARSPTSAAGLEASSSMAAAVPVLHSGFNKAQAAVLAVLAQDAFALHYHWQYDPSQIPRPIPPHLADPTVKYHGAKKAGDFTHIGDAIVLSLETIAEKKTFDPADFAKRFQALFSSGYSGWLTGANKDVLAGLAEHKPYDQLGSNHDDTEGTGKGAPLLLLPLSNESSLQAETKKLAGFVYRQPDVLLGAQYFTTAAYHLLQGKASSPVDALKQVLKEEPFASNDFLPGAVEQGLASVGEDTAAFAKQAGLSCSVKMGLPIAVHVIAKYENDLTAAIEQNTGAGGDSSARGLAVAMLLAAHHGPAALPSYTTEIKDYEKIVALLKQI
eukprot:jgi/Chlat1/4998/Chrsp32S04972